MNNFDNKSKQQRKIMVYIMIAAAGLLLGGDAAQAKMISMPDKPIIIKGLNPVEFDHSIHREMEVPCGECHHDDNHDPRKDVEIFAITDPKLLHCDNCHNKNFANTFLQSRDEIFHINCKTCHAVGINGNRGPRKCSGCHINKRK